LAAGAFWIYQSLPEWSLTSRELAQPALVTIERGVRLQDLAELLEREQLIDSSSRFCYWIKLYGRFGRFQAGTYRFEKAVSPKLIADTIEAGKIWQPIALQYVIPEGFTLKQVIDRLFANGVGSSKAELDALSRDQSLLQKYQIKGSDVEGYLYPATYSFQKMPTPRQAFEKMIDTFFAALPRGFLEALKAQRLSLQEAIVFASLIERETQLDSEREKVAEVIWNRLKAGEPLGIDAALIYGIVDYRGDIKTVHLRDARNRYNTRIHKGLPPGPIGAVSIRSLEAILKPTQNGYRFYVLRADGSKEHHFSRTMSEHDFHVKQLIQASQQQ
jgi:UPF0755 protein